MLRSAFTTIIVILLFISIIILEAECLTRCKADTLVGRGFASELPIQTESAAEWILRVDGSAQAALDFSSRTSSLKTSWFGIQFKQELTTCIGGACTDERYMLQRQIYGIPFQFAGNTLIADSTPQWPDIQFAEALRTQSGSRFTMAGKGGKGAFWMNGCAPPQFRVRVSFLFSNQVAIGQVSEDCYRRTIMITQVAEDDSADFVCQLPYSINGLRNLMDVSNREVTYAARRLVAKTKLQTQYFSGTADGMRIIFLADSQIDNLLDCVEPASGAIGGMWVLPTTTAPGTCTKCSTNYVAHAQARYCNRSLPEDKATEGCCYGCARGYMWKHGACVAECRRNYQYNEQTGVCAACPTGAYGSGAADTCKTCAERGFTNARVDALRGCVECEPRSLGVGGMCVPCPIKPEPQVAVGGVCTACSSLGAFFLSVNSVCEPCGAGTYMQGGTTFCQVCAVNTFSARPKATACARCANGFYSLPNRTSCIACQPIDQVTMYYSRYYEPGCNKQCAAGEAYTAISAYAANGCKACSTMPLGVGMYRPSSGDCSRAIPCVNGPAKGVYTGAGTPAGVCPYECVGGYGGSQCTPCASSGFVESRHIYLKGTACEYSCKPYVYRDTALQCNQPCLDLADRVLSRVSEYTRLGWTLKSYELGRCGTNDAIPTSDIPFLRKGRWGVLTLTKSCGNALLELGEKCDDGNAVSGDGCSSTCQIETDANYWDCDVIGAACVRMCGWSTQASDSWGIGLRGFLLPSCPGGICSCLNKSYHEVLQEKAGDRRRWMFDRFSPCNCGGNLQRTVSYEDCTLSNKGCRECKTGNYHDDLRGECVACGSDCAFGYRKNSGSMACQPLFSSSANLVAGVTTSMQQTNIGCIACPSTAYAVRYVSNDCRFMCYKDTTGENTAADTYCSVAANSEGVCTGACLPCSQSLSDRVTEYTSGVMSLRGQYIERCTDRYGHRWQPCSTAGLPTNAVWSTGATTVGAKTGCEWLCPGGTTYAFQRGCLACKTVLSIADGTCRSGETLRSCDGSALLNRPKACVPCEGATPYPWQVWTTSAATAFGECVEDCEAGVSWSERPRGLCVLCTQRACLLGERYVDCTARADSECTICEKAGYPSLPANEEYVTAGLCTTRCVEGFYYSGMLQKCVGCIPTTGSCLTGQTQNTFCLEVEARRLAPTCQVCDKVLGENQVWALGSRPCMIACVVGYVWLESNQTCAKCSAALCKVGEQGVCTESWSSTYYDCTPCASPLQAHEEFLGAGLCGKRCKSGFVMNQLYHRCESPTTAVHAETPSPQSADTPSLIYPRRAMAHSGVIIIVP